MHSVALVLLSIVCADSPRSRVMKYPILLKEVKKKVGVALK